MHLGMIRGTLMVAGLLLGSTAWADVEQEERFEFEVSSGARFALDNVNGDVVITGGSGDRIEVIARKKAKDEKGLERLEILVDADSDRVSIDTKHHKQNRSWFSWGDGGGSVSYEVKVPRDVELDSVETVNGGVRISGVDGEVVASTVNGSLEIHDLSSDVALETVNGRIEADFARLDDQQFVRMDTVNGSIRISLPADANARVSAETVNGSIRGDDFDLQAEKGFVGRSMDGDIGNGSARVKLDTVNGTIRIDRN